MKTALFTILVFGLVIAVHEFGHFIVAKLAGVKVHEFALGMGPKLFNVKKGETDYTLRLLPIGGYVKMEGEDESSDDARSFGAQPGWAKIAIVAAGAFMNFILAIVVFIIYSYNAGTYTNTISLATDGMPAAEAGIIKGDKVIAVGDKKTDSWIDVTDEISNYGGDKLNITIKRGEETKTFSVTPVVDKEENRNMIGIQATIEKSIPSAIKGGFSNFMIGIKMMFEFIEQLFKGDVSKDDVSGPIGIIAAVDEASKHGFMYVLLFTGLISINLGVFNLLPIPALDGSRIVFIAIELLRGKPIDPNKEGIVHMVGFVALILLMVVVAFNDIIKFDILGKIIGLFG